MSGGAPAGAWDEVAAPYARYWAPRFLPYLRDAVAALAPEAGPLAVPGCGPGEEVLLLARRWPERPIEASDPAPHMRRLLRERLVAEGLERQVRVHAGAAEDLTDAVSRAGAVLSTFTLQLLPDPAGALTAWAACLAPGAPIVALFWPRQPDGAPWRRLSEAIEQETGVERTSFEPQLRGELARLGLRLRAERTLVHPIRYGSPEEAFAQLVGACSLATLRARIGVEATAACGRRWLADHGLRPDGGEWVDEPHARLWVLERTQEEAR